MSPTNSTQPDQMLETYAQALQSIQNFRLQSQLYPLDKNQLIGLVSHLGIDQSYVNNRTNRIINAIRKNQMEKIPPLLNQLEGQIKSLIHIQKQITQYSPHQPHIT